MWYTNATCVTKFVLTINSSFRSVFPCRVENSSYPGVCRRHSWFVNNNSQYHPADSPAAPKRLKKNKKIKKSNHTKSCSGWKKGCTSPRCTQRGSSVSGALLLLAITATQAKVCFKGTLHICKVTCKAEGSCAAYLPSRANCARFVLDRNAEDENRSNSNVDAFISGRNLKED